MVLRRKLDVRQRDGRERSHEHQHDKRQEQDTKERVDRMAPDRCENVVQLDVNGAEWEAPSCDDKDKRTAVARDGRDLTRNLVRTTRRLEIASGIPSSNASDNCQRQRHCDEQREHDHDSTKRQCR